MANLSNINNKFLVTTGGNVLIGQTAAVGTSILQVTGSVNITGGTTSGLNITTSGTQDTININRAASNDNAITKYQTASADKWIVGLRNTSDDNFRFYSYGTSTDVLTINQGNGNSTFAGNVFLPDNKYATFGGANNAWELQIGVVGDNAFIEKTATTNGDLYIKNNGSGKGIIFQNGGATALTIDSSQNSTFTGSITCNSSIRVEDAVNIYYGSKVLQLKNVNNVFSIRNGNSGLVPLTIDSSGNVGIKGTPSTFSNFTNFTIQGGSSGSNLDFKNTSGTRVAAIVSSPGTDFGIETNEATPILFKPNTTTALTLDTLGNSTFAGKITQSVNSGGTAASFTNADATNGYGLAIQSEGTANTRYALILRNINATVNYGGVSTMTNQVGFWGIGVSPTGTLGSRLTVQDNVSIGDTYTGTAAPSNGMIVQGNVGIGTASPDVSGAGSSSTVLSVIETVGNRRGILELGDNQNADTGGIGSINFVGTYQDAGHKIMAEIRASGSGTTSGQRGSFISMFTKANGTATIKERMTIDAKGVLSVKSNNTNQASFEQTLAIKKQLGNNGVAIPVAYIDHTHSLDITVIVKQDTANVASAKGHSVCSYGVANTGATTVTGVGNVSNIAIAYLNTNPSGQDYVLTITPTFSAGVPPVAYVTIRGNSTGAICEY